MRLFGCFFTEITGSSFVIIFVRIYLQTYLICVVNKGVILTGQTRLRFGSAGFSSVHFGRNMRGQNHVRFTLVQYGVC